MWILGKPSMGTGHGAAEGVLPASLQTEANRGVLGCPFLVHILRELSGLVLKCLYE